MLLVLIAILILANALFVMVEMALVSARKARLQSRADRGDLGARVALTLLEKPTQFLSTIQIGITLISILMGAFGEAAIADRLRDRLAEVPEIAAWARPISLIVTVLILTYLTLVLAEIVPKRIGQARAESIAAWCAPIMRLISIGAAPLIWLLTASTELILRLIPLRTRAGDDSTEDEVKALLATGAQSGVFHEEERELVQRVFKLSDMRVTALMIPRTDIDYLLTDDTIQRVRVVLATTNHSHYPVCKPVSHAHDASDHPGQRAGAGLDQLVGVVHVKDLVHAGLIADEINLATIARPPVYVPESTPAIKVLDQFRAGAGGWASHIAFVINEYGSIVGMITFNDLLGAIVGEADAVSRSPDDSSHDPEIFRRADGSYLLDAMLPVGELKELMGVTSLPREDEAGYETLGGFVLSHLGRIPATGDFFELTAPDVGWQNFTPDRVSQSADMPSDSSDQRDDHPRDTTLTHELDANTPGPTAPLALFSFEVIDMDRTRVDKVLLTIAPEVAQRFGPAGEGV